MVVLIGGQWGVGLVGWCVVGDCGQPHLGLE